jgi:hypothetical protein
LAPAHHPFRMATNAAYYAYLKNVAALYQFIDYKNAVLTYSQAFKILAEKALPNVRYNANCAWANMPTLFFSKAD